MRPQHVRRETQLARRERGHGMEVRGYRVGEPGEDLILRLLGEEFGVGVRAWVDVFGVGVRGAGEVDLVVEEEEGAGC